ncbi:MAG: threonylcarbamoyl-AMP synthase [Muribaculaceae bacterium]|nr:threonylcarbamoyl-AMP synthase [Muribaculaceae bacterium]
MYSKEDLSKALDVLRRGGVILYPTDTVWGLGCDATRADAVKRIFDIKRRADGKALITLLASADDLTRWVDGVPEVAYQLIDVAVSPTTIIYDRAFVPPIAANLPAPDGTLAVRITAEPFSAALCRALRRPLVSTSANISGTPAPQTFRQISKEIISAVDYVCTTGRNYPPASPSAIIRLTESGEIKIIR